MCHYSSSVLHNISQLAQNRTRLYRLQLDMRRQEEQEGEEFNPLWNITFRPDPFNRPAIGLIFVNSTSKRIRSSGAQRISACMMPAMAEGAHLRNRSMASH